MQAKFLGQSELMTHSGLQFGGAPMNPGRQEQAGCPLTGRHCEFGPHDDERHGFEDGFGSRGGSAEIIKLLI